MSDTDLQRLIDAREIERLKARYCRFIDTKQWDALRGLFTPDATCDGFAAAPNGASAEEFISGAAERLAAAVTVHHCHLADIIFLSADIARAVWAMEDFDEWLHGVPMPDAPEAQGFCGYGFYEEEYRRAGGVWKIHIIRLKRLRVDPIVNGQRVPYRGTWARSKNWLAPSPDWLNPSFPDQQNRT